jgi:Glyoxalase-like domain
MGSTSGSFSSPHAMAAGAEGKTAKNRVHLDIQVVRGANGERRKRLVSEKVEQLVRAGATLAWENETLWGDSVVLRDPEGNEFCVS